jgi:hypothetical protein
MKILSMLQILKSVSTQAVCPKCSAHYSPKWIEITNVMDNNVKLSCVCSTCGNMAEIQAGLKWVNWAKIDQLKLVWELMAGIVKVFAGDKLQELKKDVETTKEVWEIDIQKDNTQKNESPDTINDEYIAKLEESIQKSHSVSDMFWHKWL